MIWSKSKEYEKLKYEFVTIIAHKFRTPLSQVKWLLEEITSKEQDPYIKESLSTINQSNQKLISLTNTLVELTDSADKSLAQYNFEKINICEITTQTVSSFKDRFHEKNLFFSIQCENPEIFVKADRTRMEFVIQTLLENSINYSPPGRNVEITVSQNKPQNASRAFISVTDHGIGINPVDAPRIFSKFFRSDSARSMDTEGFGVGLFLAESIVKRHKGKIEAFSEGPDRGATFTITLPLS